MLRITESVVDEWLRVFVGILVISCAGMANAEPLQLPAIQVLPLLDSQSGRSYELYVKVPEDYDARGSVGHPVIYVADAMWHIELISGSLEYLVDDAILVGVSWDTDIPVQQSRMRDYMPTKYLGDYEHATGEAESHRDFFERDVFAYIEANFRVDPARRTFFGYSASGTFGAFMLLSKPDMFESYLLGAPATLFDGGLLHEDSSIAETTQNAIEANVFIAVGEDDSPGNVANAKGLADYLRGKMSRNSKLEFQIVPAANHGKAFPAVTIQSLYWLSGITMSVSEE